MGISVEQAEEETGERPAMTGERSFEIEVCPQYGSLPSAVARCCASYLKHGGAVVELRCGKGELMAALLPSAVGDCRFVGFDEDPSNVEACRDRFRSLAHRGFVQVDERNAEDVPRMNSCLTIESHVLSDMGRDEALGMLSRLRRSLSLEGAIVVIERSDVEWGLVLREAGFSDARTIWSDGMTAAVLADR